MYSYITNCTSRTNFTKRIIISLSVHYTIPTFEIFLLLTVEYCVQNIIQYHVKQTMSKTGTKKVEPIEATISIVVNPFKQSVYMFLT